MVTVHSLARSNTGPCLAKCYSTRLQGFHRCNSPNDCTYHKIHGRMPRLRIASSCSACSLSQQAFCLQASTHPRLSSHWRPSPLAWPPSSAIFFPALEPFLPECPLRLLGVDDPPRLLLLGLKLLGLFMDTHQKPPLILTGTDRRTHTHTLTNTNAQRDSWPWKYSCSRLHLSSCTSRIYPGSPSSAPGFSWAYIWFGHLGIGV